MSEEEKLSGSSPPVNSGNAVIPAIFRKGDLLFSRMLHLNSFTE